MATGLLLVTILALAAALRLFRLGHESLWLDEAFSVSIAKSTLRHIVDETAIDVHPPLYYFLLYGWYDLLRWLGLSGPLEATARLLSTLFNLGTIAATYAVGARLLTRRAGLAAAAGLALARFQVEFSQEARMYALLALLATLATYALLRWTTTSEPHRRRWLMVYAGLVALLTYTHAYSAFVITAHATTVGLDAARRGSWRLVEGWVVAMLAVSAAFLPWLAVFAGQFTLVQRGFWIPDPAWYTVFSPLVTYAGSSLLAALLIPLACYGALRARRIPPADAPAPVSVLIPWLCGPIVLPMVLSLIGSPIFLPKYTIAASVPFAILAGCGLVALPGRAGKGLVTAVVLGLAAWSLQDFYAARRKDGWRDAVWNLETAARPGDAVIFYPFFNEIPYSLYSRRTDLDFIPYPRHAELMTTTTIKPMLGYLAGRHDRIWLVVLQYEARKAVLTAELDRLCDTVTRTREWHIDIFACERRESGR